MKWSRHFFHKLGGGNMEKPPLEKKRQHIPHQLQSKIHFHGFYPPKKKVNISPLKKSYRARTASRIVFQSLHFSGAYPIIYRDLCIPGGCLGILNHQQYVGFRGRVYTYSHNHGSQEWVPPNSSYLSNSSPFSTEP